MACTLKTVSSKRLSALGLFCAFVVLSTFSLGHANVIFPSHHRGLGLGMPSSHSRKMAIFRSPSSHAYENSKSPLSTGPGGRRSRTSRHSRYPVAMTVDGGIASETFFGGLHNFLQIYNFVLTARILLSWFPQFAQQPVFQPLFTITNPFFNIFRGLIPPIGGLDLSPLPAFFLLSFLSNQTLALSMETASNDHSRSSPFTNHSNRRRRRRRRESNQNEDKNSQTKANNQNNHKLQKFLRTKRLAVPVTFIMPPVEMKKLF